MIKWTLLGWLFIINSLSAQDSRFVFSHRKMGTEFRVIMYAGSQEQAKTASQAAFNRIDALNAILSDYEPESELNKLSSTSGKGYAVPVSSDLWKVMARAQHFAESSSGGFDVSVGPLVRLWRRARRLEKMPDRGDILEAKASVGFEYVQLLADRRAIQLSRPKMRLDLGGIAKGYAVDEAMKVLKAYKINSALIDGGGDILVSNPPPGREGWAIEVGVLNDSREIESRIIFVKNAAIATSGDTYRFIELDGQRFSHIVDPETGLGLTDRSKVTVVAPDGMTADAMASALSVMGPAKGIPWVNKYQGASALIILTRDDKREQHYTPQFFSYFHQN